ncbi:uncharacterized protein LOC111704225 [Eurytemora carolleeae]|uniref:uncharacterized protein LOC111704225 n=1 Tax=Eurytemora carolleeae TaxID=1294199 RepID=UPI000C78C494|nr:uncharacterized protein LOC111704225 [Eurytemora carolleeae]|eukprot:XP_023332147.1 uncharacterized protein LOC111704225 [Eurytemora affinis]
MPGLQRHLSGQPANMFFNIIILLNAGLLNAIDSSLFVKEEVPVANLNLVEEQDFVQSAFICSLKFLGKKAEGGDCQVFNYVNTTESCFLGSFSENDKSDKDNSTQLVWKQRGCPVPEDPEHGRWNCLKNIKQEKCFLVCSPGYVAQSYRGLYCNHGANAEWDKPLDEFKCLPTIIAVTGGLLSPTNKQFYTFGPNGQRLYTQGITQQTRQHVVQYFSGKITYCGGDPKAGWINTGCYYYDFDLGNQFKNNINSRKQKWGNSPNTQILII